MAMIGMLSYKWRVAKFNNLPPVMFKGFRNSKLASRPPSAFCLIFNHSQQTIRPQLQGPGFTG